MKVLVTPRSYGKSMPELFDRLNEAGLEVLRNDTGNTYSKQQMMELIKDCDGVIVGVDPLDKDVLDAAGKLKAIAKYGTGVDNIDTEEAQRRGIKVSITRGANSDSVADCAFAMMAALARKLPTIDAHCRQKDWKKITTKDISHGKLGIVGLGAIGKILAKRATGFEMKIMAYDTFWDEEFIEKYGIKKASLEEIYKECDFISLHVPLLPETQNMIGARELSVMKNDVILINCARGELIDENALLDALENGKIGGAGLDVFVKEPPEDPRWFTLDNVILGSHCAASAKSATDNMGTMATENIIRDLLG